MQAIWIFRDCRFSLVFSIVNQVGIKIRNGLCPALRDYSARLKLNDTFSVFSFHFPSYLNHHPSYPLLPLAEACPDLRGHSSAPFHSSIAALNFSYNVFLSSIVNCPAIAPFHCATSIHSANRTVCW